MRLASGNQTVEVVMQYKAKISFSANGVDYKCGDLIDDPKWENKQAMINTGYIACVYSEPPIYRIARGFCSADKQYIAGEVLSDIPPSNLTALEATGYVKRIDVSELPVKAETVFHSEKKKKRFG